MNAHPFGRGGPPDWDWHRRRLRLIWIVQVTCLVFQMGFLAASMFTTVKMIRAVCQ